MPEASAANRKISLITGASRGVGAATALKLAASGSDIIVNYRSKGSRAEDVVSGVEQLGRRAMSIQADLTNPNDVERMLGEVARVFGRLDVLILNASGGLEKGKAEDYAMVLNHDAQLLTARSATKLMSSGGRIVFVTSHWAHFYGEKPVFPGYELVAESKHAGERALRGYASELDSRGISLVVISGDAIEGTITLRLLERSNPGLLEHYKSETGLLPTVQEFADVIAEAALNENLSSGQTIFVGTTE